MMTMSRRPRVGACEALLMSTRKMGPFIAPSIRKGATILVVAQAGDESVAFQCPCGTDAISRSPRGNDLDAAPCLCW